MTVAANSKLCKDFMTMRRLGLFFLSLSSLVLF